MCAPCSTKLVPPSRCTALQTAVPEALEFIVNKQSKYIGEPLKNLRLRLKKNILISCITHHGNTVIPDGESYYQLGDTVIVVTTREQPVLQFNDIFV